MPGHRKWVQRAQPRTYVEIVDREEFTLLDAPLAEPDPWGPKEYLIRRGGQAALSVHARDKGFYYIHSPLDSDRNHMGYVQHSRRGALLAGALLLTRGIPPPRPEVGEANLRRLVANRPGEYSYSVPGARLGRPGSRSPQSQRPLKAGTANEGQAAVGSQYRSVGIGAHGI